MDQSVHAKYFHAIRWVKGYFSIERCDRIDTWHIRVLGFWFLWPCILQGECRTWDDGYWKVAWRISQGRRTHVLLYTDTEGNDDLNNNSSTPHQSREVDRRIKGQCYWVWYRNDSLLQVIRIPNLWWIKDKSWRLVRVPLIWPGLSGGVQWHHQ